MNARRVGRFVLAASLCAAAAAIDRPAFAQPAAQNPRFRLFDATSYADKPALSRYGIEPLRIVGEQEALLPGDRQRLPPVSRIRRSAAALAAPNGLVVLDIESWDTHGSDRQAQDSLAKLLRVLHAYQQARPDLRFGYYGVPPLWDKRRALLPDGAPDKRRWIADNERLRPLANDVAALFPSLYTSSPDPGEWRRFAQQYVEEARRLAGSRPVYVFLWPRYHEGTPGLAGQYVPAEYWRLMLETAYELADGAVIWGGWRRTWDERAAWWTATKRFVDERMHATEAPRAAARR